MANSYIISITVEQYNALLANTVFNTGVANGFLYGYTGNPSFANGSFDALTVTNLTVNTSIFDTIIANTLILGDTVISPTGGAWAAQQYAVANVSSDSANVGWNLNVEQVKDVTLTANSHLDRPSNMKSSGAYMAIIRQDVVGGRVLTYANSVYVWSGNAIPTLSTGPNTADIISCVSNGSHMLCATVLDFVG